MANNQNQSGGQSGGRAGGQSGGQSARGDVGQGDVKNPQTDGRLKENGGGKQGQGELQSSDDGRLKENGGGQQNRGQSGGQGGCSGN